jgi:hypothetical protein
LFQAALPVVVLQRRHMSPNASAYQHNPDKREVPHSRPSMPLLPPLEALQAAALDLPHFPTIPVAQQSASVTSVYTYRGQLSATQLQEARDAILPLLQTSEHLLYVPAENAGLALVNKATVLTSLQWDGLPLVTSIINCLLRETAMVWMLCNDMSLGTAGDAIEKPADICFVLSMQEGGITESSILAVLDIKCHGTIDISRWASHNHTVGMDFISLVQDRLLAQMLMHADREKVRHTGGKSLQTIPGHILTKTCSHRPRFFCRLDSPIRPATRHLHPIDSPVHLAVYFWLGPRSRRQIRSRGFLSVALLGGAGPPRWIRSATD